MGKKRKRDREKGLGSDCKHDAPQKSGTETELHSLVEKVRGVSSGVTVASPKKKAKHSSTSKGQEVAGLAIANPPRSGSNVSGAHPFPTDYNDHFETSSAAYHDLSHALKALAKVLKVKPNSMSIYDPYYCNGAVVDRLKECGFSRVYNKNEDFYKVVKESRVPLHDCIVTNPPFSGDHKERLFKFLTQKNCGKPWAALLPNYVATKNYFREIVCNQDGDCINRCFFIVPVAGHKYEFEHPDDTGHASSPFVSMWFLGGLDKKDMQTWVRGTVEAAKTVKQSKGSLSWAMVPSLAELKKRNLVSSSKRPSPKQRRKLAASRG